LTDAARAYREALAADPSHEGARAWLPRAEAAAQSATNEAARNTAEQDARGEKSDG
jgi:hypothetical protein